MRITNALLTLILLLLAAMTYRLYFPNVLEVSGDVNVGNTVQISGSVDVDNIVDVTGYVEIEGTADITGSVYVDGGSIDIN